MSIAFVPTYIKFMGIEAYGLIGIFALLQAWLTLFDMGMTPALSREMARFNGGVHDHQSIRDLLRSVEILGSSIATFLGICIWLSSDWLATSWLKVERIPTDQVAQAFSIMGFVIALRSLENIYRSSLVGLEKQVTVNLVSSILATFRGLGAIAILKWVSASVEAFFLWQGFISLLSAIWMGVLVYKALPKAAQTGAFSIIALKKIWRFASGVLMITLLSFLLMQTDKILLSQLLTLQNFGYYSLAAMVAGCLYMVAGPIGAAFFPRFTVQASSKDNRELISTFHLGSQLISVLVGSAAVVIAVFADVFLLVWTGDVVLVQKLAPLLRILAIGTLFNCLMHMPYQLQLSHGWTSFTVKFNCVAVVVMIPAIYLVAPRYGAEGAAWLWLLLNGSYLLVAIHIVFARLLTTEKWKWYVDDLLKPLGAALILSLIFKFSLPTFANRAAQLVALILITSGTLFVAGIAASQLRAKTFVFIISLIFSVKKAYVKLRQSGS